MKLLDGFHFFIMFLLLLGGLFLPIEMLPGLIFFQVFFLSRYHDYCVISRITELANNVYSGCEVEKDFTGEMVELYEQLGIKPSKRLLSNISTAMVSVSVLFSLFRMSRRYQFNIIPPKHYKWNLFLAFNFIFVLISETAIDYFADARFPKCDAGFTPIEQIKTQDLKSNRYLK